MLNKFTHIAHSFLTMSLVIVALLSVSACDNSAPPELMKASKQFESDEIRDRHVAHMRINHMDELLHKRDQTMYEGIRTKKHSLNACINCHVPETHNGEVLRHTNPEHFCSTCHGYVAAQLDCFDCHVDHPVKEPSTAEIPSDQIHQQLSQPSIASETIKAEVKLAKNSAQKNIEINASSDNSKQGGSLSE